MVIHPVPRSVITSIMMTLLLANESRRLVMISYVSGRIIIFRVVSRCVTGNTSACDMPRALRSELLGREPPHFVKANKSALYDGGKGIVIGDEWRAWYQKGFRNVSIWILHTYDRTEPLLRLSIGIKESHVNLHAHCC